MWASLVVSDCEV